MPRIKATDADLVREFGADVLFVYEHNVMFCNLCSKAFVPERKFAITQHVKTVSHKEAEKRRASARVNHQSQQLLATMHEQARERESFNIFIGGALYL